MTLAGRVAERAAAEGVRAVFVDEGGVGAGVVDRLRQLGVPFVFGVNFGGARRALGRRGAKPLYANKRAEMWGNMKDWLAQGAVPTDAELRADLCGVEYGFNGKNEIQLEKKDDMKKRGLASPDLADALALTFAHPGDRRLLGPAADAAVLRNRLRPLRQVRRGLLVGRLIGRSAQLDLAHLIPVVSTGAERSEA